MKHRVWWGALLCALSTLGAAPRNVVFILADDLGYGDLSCYGATRIRTPACDRLSREGMRFTDAHSPSAVCTPTRYAFLTGRYAWRGWLKNWVLFEHHPALIEQGRETVANLFQKAGYATGCVGKWHLGWGKELDPDFSNPVIPGPLDVGFDMFFGVPHSHNSNRALQVFIRDREIVGLPPGASFKSKEAMEHTVRSLEDTATDLSREAVAFIHQHADTPFFLYYPTTNIHFPLTPHSRFKGTTDAGTYGEFVTEFDWAVGEILQALDQHDLTRKTLIVVTSDNGGRPDPRMGDHRCNGSLRGTKRQIYEGGHRIPLLMRWPGVIPEGSTSSETVCLTDFFETFATLLGQEVQPGSGEDSFDLAPVWSSPNRKAPLRPFTIHHSVRGQFSIRKGPWKLIEGSGDGDYPRDEKGRMKVVNRNPERDPTTGAWSRLDYFGLEPDGNFQLFHLEDDPAETRDLAAAHPDTVAELRKYLDETRSLGYTPR